jgi:hypothetical protein
MVEEVGGAEEEEEEEEVVAIAAEAGDMSYATGSASGASGDHTFSCAPV